MMGGRYEPRFARPLKRYHGIATPDARHPGKQTTRRDAFGLFVGTGEARDYPVALKRATRDNARGAARKAR